MKAFKVFSLLGLFFLLFSSISYGADKPKFSKGEEVFYLTHAGIYKKATILRVIRGTQIRYAISCGLFRAQVMEESVVRELIKEEVVGAFHSYHASGGRRAKENRTPPLGRKLTANAKRWVFSRDLPVKKGDSPLVPL